MRTTFYTKLPLRKIARRWTEVGDPRYPVPMVELECGHSDRWTGQKGKMRCWQCGRDAGAYDRRETE